MSRFVTLLDELTGDPSTVVGDADVLSPGERADVLALSEGTRDELPAVGVADLIADRLVADPDATALTFG